MTNRRSSAALFSIAFALLPLAARAQEDSVIAARAEFLRGAELVKKSQWAEALAAFEAANKLRPHAVTTYNIGACQRAMGQYTRARSTFMRALSQNEAAGASELAESLVSDTKTFIADTERLLATITITLDPATAAVTFDGRPLALEDAKANPPVLVAGVLPPGAGEKPPAATFSVRTDPGPHVIIFSRKGYSDAVVNRTLAPSSKTALPIMLDTLPATLKITSQPKAAVVTVAGADVGLTPVDVLRPAGQYRVVVKKSGYVTFDSEITARAGEELDIGPTLQVQTTSILQRWWFWTAVSALAVGAAIGVGVGVYTATAKPPPVNGGGLGWAVQVN